MVELINEQFLKDNELILEVNGNQFLIPKALGEFLQKTDSLNDETVEMTKSKTGVITLKIKSLTYSPYNFKGNSKTFNLYKSNQTNNNKGANSKMKVFIKFMKPKHEGTKPYFNNLIMKIVKPAISNIEFDNLDQVKEAVSKALKNLENENSKWTIENNTKTEGLVVKNEYHKEGREFPSHNIFFINVTNVVNSEQS